MPAAAELIAPQYEGDGHDEERLEHAQLANTRAASLRPARSHTAASAAHAAGRRLGNASSAAAACATPSSSIEH
jgi:hypothetical protein